MKGSRAREYRYDFRGGRCEVWLTELPSKGATPVFHARAFLLEPDRRALRVIAHDDGAPIEVSRATVEDTLEAMTRLLELRFGTRESGPVPIQRGLAPRRVRVRQ